jgi:hypothetical protein
MRTKPKRFPTERTNTIDQHLLAEIRDELQALPLARELRSDVGAAKALRHEFDELRLRLERVEQVQRLLARVTGLDPESLTEDELALLADAGALEEGVSV